MGLIVRMDDDALRSDPESCGVLAHSREKSEVMMYQYWLRLVMSDGIWRIVHLSGVDMTVKFDESKLMADVKFAVNEV
jgi:hypothetical protein